VGFLPFHSGAVILRDAATAGVLVADQMPSAALQAPIVVQQRQQTSSVAAAAGPAGLSHITEENLPTRISFSYSQKFMGVPLGHRHCSYYVSGISSHS